MLLIISYHMNSYNLLSKLIYEEQVEASANRVEDEEELRGYICLA